MKRLVLAVEGEGDVEAAPNLVGRLLPDSDPAYAGYVFLDPAPLRVKDLKALAARGGEQWRRMVGIAASRSRFGGLLLLLDGDTKRFRGEDFCPVRAARWLAGVATAAGGGRMFSVGVVFACREYESWLIPSYPTLPGSKPGVELPDDPEATPRDAKRWLTDHLGEAYKPTVHQLPLTRAADVRLIRSKAPRSFRRLESALRQLIEAIRTDQHIVSPVEES